MVLAAVSSKCTMARPAGARLLAPSWVTGPQGANATRTGADGLLFAALYAGSEVPHWVAGLKGALSVLNTYFGTITCTPPAGGELGGCTA